MYRLLAKLGAMPGRVELDTKTEDKPPTAYAISHNILGRASRSRSRLYIFFAAIIITLVSIHAARLNPHIAKHIPVPLWRTANPSPRNLHILIPASEPSLGLCRNLLTGALLNYPTPTLINWGLQGGNGSHQDMTYNMAKISGVEKWIKALSKENRQSEDLLMIIDGYDIWYQLRPHVLVNRYHQALKESNRITKIHMGGAFNENHLGQAVIFGASKRCEPNFGENIACWPVPESPLPPDLYGPMTDTSTGQKEVTSFQPRYADSGVMIGKIDALWQIFHRAWDNRDEPQRGDGGDPRSIFNTIYGMQEFQRTLMIERRRSLWVKIYRKIESWFGVTRASILDDHPTHEMMEPDIVRAHDFGIGLDYYSMLSHDTIASERDVRYIINAQEDHSLDLGVRDCRPHLQELPDDVARTYINPPRVHEELFNNKTWSDLPLYTNICTGNVPPLIHHHGTKEERDVLWQQFWMAPVIKEMFHTLRRFVEMNSPEDGRVNVGVSTGEVRTDTGEKLSWKDVCEPFEEELFRQP